VKVQVKMKCDPHQWSDPFLYGKGDECMICGTDRKESEQLDREIVKRAMKWRAEAEARERANTIPKFKPLAEIEERISKSYEAEMEHYEFGT